MCAPLAVMLSSCMLLTGPPGATLAADLPEAVLLPRMLPWSAGLDADALVRALQSTALRAGPADGPHAGDLAGHRPRVSPIRLCRCLCATVVALDPQRFLALGAEAARRGAPAWHAAVGDAVDALPDSAVQACLERQRR
jgi:hypothetical protein